jgi:FMN-dependent NADH-azoreductase
MDDVEFVYAEGLALGEDSRRSALTAAHADIARLASSGVALAEAA